MLRLRPSELTLTPEDVDETFRRIALGQTSRAQQHWTMPPAGPSGPSGPSGRPNRPILRRGPQRLIRHAMTINNMSILQPQQAVSSLVHQDDEESHQEATQPLVRANSRPSLPHPTHQRTGATVGFPAALPSHSMQLPLRLRSHLQAGDAQTIFNEQTESSTPLTPQNHLSSPASAAPTRNVENGNELRAQLPSVDSSANPPGLRGGGLASVARPHNVTQDTIYAASPLNHIQRFSSRSGGGLANPARTTDVARDSILASDQTQRLTSPTYQVSPGDPTKPQSNLDIGCPTPRSKNCSTETPHSTHCPDRTRKYPPSSEPRRGSGRHAPTARSRSPGDVASSSVICSSASILEDPSNDISVPSATTEPPSRHYRGPFNPHSEDGDAPSTSHLSSTLGGLGQSDQTSLRRGSGATNASAAYSWYGSLGSDTQFPGSENSQPDESCSQLDGARTSTHRLSPLPSLPYTRIQNDSTASSPPPAHSRRLSRGHVSATTAVRHELESPLDVHVEPYQRQQQTRHNLLNFATHTNPTLSSVGGPPMDGPNRDQGMPSGDLAGLGPVPSYGAFRQQSPPEHQMHRLRDFSRRSGCPRLEQRSSENGPVSAPVQQGDAARHGRVQMQRAVYERLQNPVYTRHAGAAGGMDMMPNHDSAPRRNPPHDVSNQARNDMAHDGEGIDSGSPVGMRPSRRPCPGQNQHAVDAGPSRPLPGQLFRQHSAESTSNTSPRVYDGGSGGARAQSRRDGPLSTLASLEPGSDTWSRYWQSPLVRGAPTTMARAHRRVRGEQRDQENAGEEEVMRREEANVTARYGEEEQQRTTMNETPPRIGRVERRMME